MRDGGKSDYESNFVGSYTRRRKRRDPKCTDNDELESANSPERAELTGGRDRRGGNKREETLTAKSTIKQLLLYPREHYCFGRASRRARRNCTRGFGSRRSGGTPWIINATAKAPREVQSYRRVGLEREIQGERERDISGRSVSTMTQCEQVFRNPDPEKHTFHGQVSQRVRTMCLRLLARSFVRSFARARANERARRGQSIKCHVR